MLMGVLLHVAHLAPHGAIGFDVGVWVIYGNRKLTNGTIPDVLYPLQNHHM